MAPEGLAWARSKVLWKQCFSGTMIGVFLDESKELKLDRRWEGTGIDQEVDEYKTESKV